MAEDGSKGYDNLGEKIEEHEHEYSLPNGEKQRIKIEKIKTRGNTGEILIVRRNNRKGFKPGALNNVLHLLETKALRDLASVDTPDYVMIVDADHEPGRNRFLRLFLCETKECREFENKPLDQNTYEKLDEKLKKYETVGRELLNLDSYKLRSKTMDDPNSLITRAVELMEYHRKFVPNIAVVQGYQNHYADPNKGLDLLVKAAHILAQYTVILRSPKIKIEVIDKDDGRKMVYEPRENSLALKLFNRIFLRKYRKVNEFEENGKTYRAYVSSHMFPLFTGSSGIIRGDLLTKYRFADGVFTNHQSVTEDWELSIRLQRDGYLIFATHQLETWGRPPENNKVYKKQQYRWAYGTTRDIKHHFREIMRNKNLGYPEKIGFIGQISHYLGGITIPTGFIGLLAAYLTIGLMYYISAPSLSQFIYFASATLYPERFYKVPIKEIIKKTISYDTCLWKSYC